MRSSNRRVHPPNLTRIGSVVEGNGHADRKMDGHYIPNTKTHNNTFTTYCKCKQTQSRISTLHLCSTRGHALFSVHVPGKIKSAPPSPKLDYSNLNFDWSFLCETYGLQKVNE